MAGQLAFEAYAGSRIGNRIVNEDSYLCLLNPETPGWLSGLFIVADGIGGRMSGNIASALAVRTARDYVTGTGLFFNHANVNKILGEAFQAANDAVYSMSKTDSALEQMGTTLTMGLIAQRTLFVASLGDSRAYLHRGRRLLQITDDDWIPAPLDPLIAKNEDSAGKTMTLVNRAIGWPEDPDPQQHEIEIGVDDVIVLCTDGLTNALTSAQIEGNISKYGRKLDILCDRLLALSSSTHDADNTTIVAVRVLKG